MHQVSEAAFSEALQNSSLKIFPNIQRKTTVLESLFNRVADFQATLSKKDSNTGVFM